CSLLELLTARVAHLDIIRDRNQLYRVNVEGLVENTYTLKMINKA
ncbi:hypothetical protein CWB98_06300, partial [Pseudoalteromonas rubra]